MELLKMVAGLVAENMKSLRQPFTETDRAV